MSFTHDLHGNFKDASPSFLSGLQTNGESNNPQVCLLLKTYPVKD